MLVLLGVVVVVAGFVARINPLLVILLAAVTTGVLAAVGPGVGPAELGAAALDTIASWYKDGVISPAIIGEQPDAWGGMSAGNYAMISEGPWFFSSNTTTFATQATAMPTGTAGGISVVGGEDIVEEFVKEVELLRKEGSAAKSLAEEKPLVQIT